MRYINSRFTLHYITFTLHYITSCMQFLLANAADWHLSPVNVTVDDVTMFEHVCTRISTEQFSATVVVVY